MFKSILIEEGIRGAREWLINKKDVNSLS